MEFFPHKNKDIFNKHNYFLLLLQIIFCLCICLLPFALQVFVQNISRAEIFESRLPVFIVPAVAVITSILILRSMMAFPRNSRSSTMILSTVTGCFGGALLYLLAADWAFSFWLLFCSYLLMLLCCFAGYFFARRYFSMKMAVIPLGRAKEIMIPHRQNYDWVLLDSPQWQEDCHVLVADLHTPELDESWQMFIADCTLKGIPVYNIRQMEEALTGRVRLAHMYENDLGTLQPSAAYAVVKRILDTLLILLTLPITLPLMFVVGVAIILESPGGMFFLQKRVGQGGKEFTIYKFRSMCRDSEKEGAQFAAAGDMRITKIGKIIRKLRLDELPQFFNVLKGDMSLIGPRPEQKTFVEQFEKEIPFYNYRHIVKPGISGWAQVTHGYASSAEDTRVKTEYDFYYIKHFSFAMDLLIFFKTIKTMLTGFGAR